MIGDYEKINFIDNVTPLDADNMGKMDDKIAELDQNAESVGTDLTDIQEAVDNAQDAADAAQSTADSAQSAASNAQSTADSATSKNTEQDTSISTNTSDISALQTENAELKAQIAEMEEEISQLNSDLTSQSTGTITSDFATSANSCYRVGYAVNIRLQASDVSFTGTSAVLGTLPDGFRPRQTQYLFGRVRPTSSNELSVSMFIINTNGNITQNLTNSECNYFQVGGTILL